MLNFERRLETLREASRKTYQELDVNESIAENEEKIFRLMDLEACPETLEMMANGSAEPFESWKGKAPTWPKKTWSWLR